MNRLVRRRTIQFPKTVLIEMEAEAKRLDRPFIWIICQAWKLARADIRKIPSKDEI